MRSRPESRVKAVGARQTLRALRAGTALRIYLARDAASQITSPLAGQAQKQGVETFWFGSMKELGRDCGIAVGAAAAADLRE